MLPRNGYCQLFASVAYPRGCGRIRWTSGDLGESGKLGSVGNITLFDAHNRAFAFFKETCARGIYDNMKTALETVFIAKDRQYNRRFLRMWRPLPGRGDRVHAGGGLGEGQRCYGASGEDQAPSPLEAN